MNTQSEKKYNIVNDTHALALESISTILIEYSKITSLEIKFIRKKLLENNIKLKVIKNTLAKKALTNTRNDALIDYISGQIMILFSDKEISMPVKILNDFNLKNKNLKIKTMCIYGKIFQKDNIKTIMTLPKKDDAIIKLLIYIKSPIIRLLNVLKYPCINTLNLIKIITKNKKGD